MTEHGKLVINLVCQNPACSRPIFGLPDLFQPTSQFDDYGVAECFIQCLKSGPLPNPYVKDPDHPVMRQLTEVAIKTNRLNFSQELVSCPHCTCTAPLSRYNFLIMRVP